MSQQSEEEEVKHRINYLETDSEGFQTHTPGNYYTEFADAVGEAVDYVRYVQEEGEEDIQVELIVETQEDD